jgi:purine-binding chemotaxis protein CheW
MADSHLYCTFRLQELTFGIEVQTIQEVIRYQEMTPVPLAPATIQGLINLRGQIVTAIDLRARLGLPPRAAGELPMNVIVRTPDGAVSLLVDEIGEVVEVDPAVYERPPDTVTGTARELVRGVCKLVDRLLLILDVAAAVTLAIPADPSALLPTGSPSPL